MARFTLPRDLYHGKGALEELKNLKGNKAIVVVGGGSMKRFGFLDRVTDYLKDQRPQGPGSPPRQGPCPPELLRRTHARETPEQCPLGTVGLQASSVPGIVSKKTLFRVKGQGTSHESSGHAEREL